MSGNSVLAKERLVHISDALSNLKKFILNVSEQEFLSDIKLQSAILYQFLIIGEAVKYLDTALLKKYDYPWHRARALRNYIAHEYHNIKMTTVWITANNLDSLREIVSKMLKNEFLQ
jgi:uncharacterized protein with HEPN domain